MEIRISNTAQELGVDAAGYAAEVMNKSIAENGVARILLSTGASQFDFFKAFVNI